MNNENQGPVSDATFDFPVSSEKPAATPRIIDRFEVPNHRAELEARGHKVEVVEAGEPYPEGTLRFRVFHKDTLDRLYADGTVENESFLSGIFGQIINEFDRGMTTRR